MTRIVVELIDGTVEAVYADDDVVVAIADRETEAITELVVQEWATDRERIAPGLWAAFPWHHVPPDILAALHDLRRRSRMPAQPVCPRCGSVTKPHCEEAP